jgi:hypothetical protein
VGFNKVECGKIGGMRNFSAEAPCKSTQDVSKVLTILRKRLDFLNVKCYFKNLLNTVIVLY